MIKAAQEQEIDVDVEAYSVREVDAQLAECDCILLGPQVSFMKKDILEKAEPYNIPVADIASIDYGFSDGVKVLKQALSLIENKQ
jgi:PTS system cellobiose-specific IIB component